MLQASEMAAYCLPDTTDPKPSTTTRELYHVLTLTFRWWDLLIQGKEPFGP